MRALTICLGAFALAACTTTVKDARSDLSEPEVQVAQQEIAAVRSILGDRAGDPVWAKRSYDVRGNFTGWSVVERATPVLGSRLCKAFSYFVPAGALSDETLSRLYVYKVQNSPDNTGATANGCSSLDPVLEPFVIADGINAAAVVDQFLLAQANARNSFWASSHIDCDARVCISPARALSSLDVSRIKAIDVVNTPSGKSFSISFYRDTPTAGFTFDARSSVVANLPSDLDGVITLIRLTPVGS